MPNSRPPTCPPSYSTAHLARRLGVSVPTVQRWVDLGHLKAWKTVGGHRRIDAESAENFIRVQTQQRGGEGLATAAGAVAPFSVLVVDANSDDCDQLRALVVDANSDDCDQLRALVDVAVPGARVLCARNGFDALIEVGRAMPDLIVADIALAHVDGVEMIRHLCTRRDARPPAVVVVSAQVDGLGLPPGVKLLAKPVEPARFVEAVNQALDAG
jgi:excisionase family DNA binding protein